jgi:hypothetical protein
MRSKEQPTQVATGLSVGRTASSSVGIRADPKIRLDSCADSAVDQLGEAPFGCRVLGGGQHDEFMAGAEVAGSR